MNAPILGKGDQPTPEEIEQMKNARKVNLAVQFMGEMIKNLPQVYDTAEGGMVSKRIMTPAEVFEYCMGLAYQVDVAVNTKPSTLMEQ